MRAVFENMTRCFSFFARGQQPLHHQKHKADESGEDEDDGPAEAVAAEIQRKKHDDSQRQHLAQVV